MVTSIDEILTGRIISHGNISKIDEILLACKSFRKEDIFKKDNIGYRSTVYRIVLQDVGLIQVKVLNDMNIIIENSVMGEVMEKITKDVTSDKILITVLV